MDIEGPVGHEAVGAMRGKRAVVCAAAMTLIAAGALVGAGPTAIDAAAFAPAAAPAPSVDGFQAASPGQTLGRPAGLTSNSPPDVVAETFLESSKEQVGARAAPGDLRADVVRPSTSGGSVVKLQQEIDGVPVFAGEAMVDVDSDGNVHAASADTTEDAPDDVKAEVSKKRAVSVARGTVAKATGVPTSTLDASPPMKWIFDPRVVGGPGVPTTSLVWRIEVTGDGVEPINQTVLVDADKGVVLLALNNIQEARNRIVCNANSTNGSGNGAYPCTSPVITEGGAATGVTDVDNAYLFAGHTYDFYSGLGRDSLNGSGLQLISTAKYCPSGSCPNYGNAFWDGTQMVYGNGFASADDVVGHELTHGVTQYASGLIYYFQSGAINEALSDIFGEFIDQANGTGNDGADVKWLLGEDLPIGAIRSMKDPTAMGDPDRMSSPLYFEDASELDSGGVHENSGVANKAAYLITDGAAFNGQTITGLGNDKAARIFYKAATTLTAASDYSVFGASLSAACTSLIGTASISLSDCTQVNNAVLATEMASVPTQATPTQASVCGVGQSPTIVFADDMENSGSGNWAKSTTGSTSWYYGNESNPYGFNPTKPASGVNNIWGDDAGSLQIGRLTSVNNVLIPTGTTYLRFNHAYQFEQSGGSNWDGGIVEYSVDGGAWGNAGSLINSGSAYGGTLDSGNALGAISAFVGKSRGFDYTSTRIDVSSFAGHALKFRFSVGSDAIYGGYGWYIDDVQVIRCSAPALNPAIGAATSTADGFTAQINNYDSSYSWGGSATAGGSVSVSASGLITVGGLAAGTSSTATITTTKAGFDDGIAQVTGSSNPAAEPPPPPPPPPAEQPPPASGGGGSSGGSTGTSSGASSSGGGASEKQKCRTFKAKWHGTKAKVVKCTSGKWTAAKKRAGKAAALKKAKKLARKHKRRAAPIELSTHLLG